MAFISFYSKIKILGNVTVQLEIVILKKVIRGSKFGRVVMHVKQFFFRK